MDGTDLEDVHIGLSSQLRDLSVAYYRPVFSIFDNGFESGDTTGWSTTVP